MHSRPHLNTHLDSIGGASDQAVAKRLVAATLQYCIDNVRLYAGRL